MKIPVIKKLVETQTMSTLMEAEQALVNENPLPIEIEGNDEGEKLTHIIAAIWILDKMKRDDVDFKSALRDYTKMVRESIS